MELLNITLTENQTNALKVLANKRNQDNSEKTETILTLGKEAIMEFLTKYYTLEKRIEKLVEGDI